MKTKNLLVWIVATLVAIILLVTVTLLFLGILNVPQATGVVIFCIILLLIIKGWIKKPSVIPPDEENNEYPVMPPIVNENKFYRFDQTIFGDNKKVKFVSAIVTLNMYAKKGYVYTLFVRDVFDWTSQEECGKLILNIEFSQMEVLEKVQKTMQWSNCKIAFYTNFQEILWNSDFQGKTFRIKVFEKKLA